MEGSVHRVGSLCLVAMVCGAGCGGAPVRAADLDPIPSRIREIAAQHLGCAPAQIEVVATDAIATCVEREDVEMAPQLPRAVRAPRCVSWGDDRMEIERAWRASGCGYTEQFLVDPCGADGDDATSDPVRVMIVEPLDIGTLDCGTY